MAKVFKSKIFLGTICLILAAVLAFVALPSFYSSKSETTNAVKLNQDIPVGTVISGEMLSTVEVGSFGLPGSVVLNNNRVYLIEDTQELNLIKFDVENNRPARVIPNLTQEAPVKVTMFDLTKGALRYHPALIVPAEVRDGAVYQAMSAGQTGHTILTSFHADSARDSYRRLVSLCHMADVNQSDEILMSLFYPLFNLRNLVYLIKNLGHGWSRRIYP